MLWIIFLPGFSASSCLDLRYPLLFHISWNLPRHLYRVIHMQMHMNMNIQIAAISPIPRPLDSGFFEIKKLLQWLIMTIYHIIVQPIFELCSKDNETYLHMKFCWFDLIQTLLLCNYGLEIVLLYCTWLGNLHYIQYR